MTRLCLIFFIVLASTLRATHIVGGEIYYDFLGKQADGKDIYRITLKLYRDCSNPANANFDGIDPRPAYLSIRSNTRDTVVDIGVPVVTPVPSAVNSRCMQTFTMCIEQGVYTYTVALPPVAGGYTVIYQGCCRNTTILNIVQPVSQGATYYIQIPGPEDADHNSSPRFRNFPPIFLCTDVPLLFDHSAIDPDGDELEYSLYGAVTGLDQCCPQLFASPNLNSLCFTPPATCPTIHAMPPYPLLNYQPPYTPSYPLAANPKIAIDPHTGKLTGTPNLAGQFVVTVAVKEIRGGTVLNTHYRDFQFNVVHCEVYVISNMADQLKKCTGNVITFTNQSYSNTGNLSFHWDFGDPNQTNDTSNAKNPTYTYQDTGVYQVTLIGYSNKPCNDTVKRLVYVYPKLEVSFQAPPKQCLKNNALNFSPLGSFLPSATFTWNFSPDASPPISNQKDPSDIHFNKSGTFPVKLYAHHLTCIDSFIDSVRFVPRPKAVIGNAPANMCAPGRVKFINGSSATEIMYPEWQFGDGHTSTEVEPTHEYRLPGVYIPTLSIVTTGVCKDTSVVSANIITVQPAPQPGFTVSPQVTTILDPWIEITTPPTEGVRYTYLFGDGATSTSGNTGHAYVGYGTFTITQIVTNGYGCTDSTHETVQVNPEFRFWVPNSFTPNGNGINEIFKPVVIGVSEYVFEVFSRWGDVLFRTSDPKAGWDGNYRGQPCKQDIYNFKVRFVDDVEHRPHERVGQVSLFRSTE